MAKQSLSFALEPRASASFDDYVVDCAWSPDGRSFAIAGGEGKVALARAEGDSLRVDTIGEHLLGTLSVAWRPHGTASRLRARTRVSRCGMVHLARR